MNEFSRMGLHNTVTCLGNMGCEVLYVPIPLIFVNIKKQGEIRPRCFDYLKTQMNAGCKMNNKNKILKNYT